MILDRDCMCYKINSGGMLRQKRINSFEEIVILSDCNDYSIFQINWVDPIRYKEKIISKSNKSVSIIHIKDRPYIFIFGSSESYLAYAETKLCKWFPITVEHIDIFSQVPSWTIDISIPFQVVSVQFRLIKDLVEKWITIDSVDITPKELQDILLNEEIGIVVLNDKKMKVSFSIDKNSSISFSNTATMTEIIGVLKNVIRQLS